MTDSDKTFEKEYSEEEAAILRQVAERKGEEWARENAAHILNQARLVGDLSG